jgi:hypothetical protein
VIQYLLKISEQGPLLRPWACADVKAIHPKKRDQDTKSVLEKAGDTVTTTVDVGPWMYNHREAGKLSSRSQIEVPLTG